MGVFRHENQLRHTCGREPSRSRLRFGHGSASHWRVRPVPISRAPVRALTIQSHRRALRTNILSDLLNRIASCNSHRIIIALPNAHQRAG
jgi:hypothetical protein